MNRRLRQAWAPLLLMGVSGFAGLGYQIVWTQQSASWLGHENAAVLAVVAAFFGGLALGALLLGRAVERSRRPARWYIGCELAIALYGPLLAVLLPRVSGGLLRVTGALPLLAWQWSVAFFGTFLLLLPATAAMGATLPAMQRCCARLQGEGQSLAALYAANTLGAVLGVLGTALWLIPTWGLSRSALACASLNLVCAVLAWRVFAADEVEPEAATTSDDAERRRRVLVSLAATGCLGIGYEVLVVRTLSQVTESTVYTFALLLAIYLVGSAAGAAAYARWLAERRRPSDLTDTLLAALTAACLLGGASLWQAELLKAGALSAFGRSEAAAVLAEALPALLAFGPATLLMGALFSHLARRAQRSGVGLSLALSVNTLGAALAPALFGAVLAPTVGAKWALILLCCGYLLLVRRRSWRRPTVWLSAGAALALGLFGAPLAFIEVPDGGHVVSYEDSAAAAVSVVEDAEGVSRLRINNRAQEGSSHSQRVDARQAWLPLLLHPAPQRALFLGLGTGVTAASAAEDASLQVEAVELLPAVIRASAHFASSVADGAAYPRLQLLAADARRFVRTTSEHYEVIVADNYHPARSGSGSLYTVEHFEAVRARLAPGGLFCQWLPLHQLERESLRSIVQAFLAVYPGGWAVIANSSLETPVLGLLGRDRRFELSAVRQRLGQVTLPRRVTGLGFEDELAVLGSFVAGPSALRRLAANAPANTDDRPIVAYRAPRITYSPDSTPAERFIALVRELSIYPEELLMDSTDSPSSRRLTSYWLARNRFVEAGRDVRPSPNVSAMLAQVQAPLLAVLQTSPDFRPAYDPLLGMATALARSDAAAARALLAELTRVQPARAEAGQALQLLSQRQ